MREIQGTNRDSRLRDVKSQIRAHLTEMQGMTESQLKQRFAPAKLADLPVAERLAYNLLDAALNATDIRTRAVLADRIMDRVEGKTIKRVELQEEVDEKTAALIMQLEREF